MQAKKGKYFDKDSYAGYVNCTYCDSKIEVLEKHIKIVYKYLGDETWSDWERFMVKCPICHRYVVIFSTPPGIVIERILNEDKILLIIKCSQCKKEYKTKYSSLRRSIFILYKLRCKNCHKMALFNYNNLPREVKNRLDRPRII